MFTGIIREIGTVAGTARNGSSLRVSIDAPRLAPGLTVGASVAVNGACLTAVETRPGGFSADVVEETLRKTALADQVRRGHVNLETPLRTDGLLDGHIVLGHVDASAEIAGIEERGESWWFSLRLPPGSLHLVVHTGSIAVDGVSMTVAGIEGATCRLSVIPHTFRNTIFQYYRPSDRVNVEFDVIGKYVDRMLRGGPGPGPAGRPGFSASDLTDQGF